MTKLEYIYSPFEPILRALFIYIYIYIIEFFININISFFFFKELKSFIIFRIQSIKRWQLPPNKRDCGFSRNLGDNKSK
jgi:hypothetical protein